MPDRIHGVGGQQPPTQVAKPDISRELLELSDVTGALAKNVIGPLNGRLAAATEKGIDSKHQYRKMKNDPKTQTVSQKALTNNKQLKNIRLHG